MKEIWKDIKGYNGDYQVSNLGRVKSLKWNKERILAININSRGYLLTGLSKNNESKMVQVHQLVAIAFLNHTPNGHKLVVNHINFDKTDNKLVNLEIISNRENTNRKHLNSSSKFVGVSWNKKRKDWMAMININGKATYLGSFKCELSAAKAYQNKLKEIT